MVKISVVIPAYNAEQYIGECMESILSQSFADFEVIIVDDGSKDSTIEIVEQRFKDPRIRVYRNEHDFIGSLNLGMNMAAGEYIVRMDADDIMLPNRLERQYEFMEKNRTVDISGGSVEAFGAYEMKLSAPISHNDILAYFAMGCSMFHPTVILRRNLIQRFPLENGIYQFYRVGYEYAEDYKTWIDLVKMGCRFENLPEILIRYRVSCNQVTSRKHEEMVICTKKISIEYIEFMADKIVSEDRTYYKLFDGAIDQFNKKKISFDTFTTMFYYLFCDYLKKGTTKLEVTP